MRVSAIVAMALTGDAIASDPISLWSLRYLLLGVVMLMAFVIARFGLMAWRRSRR